MPLTITTVSGQTLSFASPPDVGPYARSGIQEIRGIGSLYNESPDRRVSFVTVRPQRARLAQLEPIVGLNVVQTVNRVGRVQLTSDKPCQMVRVAWDTKDHRRYGSWSGSYTPERAEGVLVVEEASLQGPRETLVLTLYCGDWLYKPDGTIERFV